MRILTFILLPFAVCAQYNNAITFQNNVRDYYELPPYQINETLNAEAQEWADYIAEIDSMMLSDDTLRGEAIYVYEKSSVRPNDFYVDASVGWVQDIESPGYYQVLCRDCAAVGFGMAESTNYVYVVAKYDKIYEY